MKGLVHFLLLLVCAQHATDLVADVLSYLLHPLGAVDDEASFVCAGKMVPLLYLCLMNTLFGPSSSTGTVLALHPWNKPVQAHTPELPRLEGEV